MNEPFELIVDTREKDNTIKALESYGIKYKREALPTGDFKITTLNGVVIVERKAITDFVHSLFSGRLEEQMRRLSQEQCPGLVITGSFAEYRRHAKTTKVTVDHIIGAVASCVVKYVLRFVIWIQGGSTQPHAAGIAITTKIMKKIAEGKIDAIPDRKLKKNVVNPTREIVGMMCGVPQNVAEELLKKFKCIRTIMDASDEELMKVHGMGRTRIAKMRRLLNGI